METARTVLVCLSWPVARLFNLDDDFNLLNLISALTIAAIFALRGARPRPGERFRAIFRALLPEGALTSPSSRLDAKVFVINSIVFVAAMNVWLFSSARWRGWSAAAMAQVFGEPSPSALPPWATRVLATILLALAAELGYYVAHRLAHRVPLLWRYHQLHHSANVLTPLTGLREHPIDLLLFGNLIGFSVGLGGALLAYPLGAGVDGYFLSQTNILLFAYALTLANLRHTHLWLPFTGLAGHLFQSPAHHQLHHSRDPAHYDRNFGYALAVFDMMFGTLLVPRERQALRFGLVDTTADPSVQDFYIGPFETARAEPRALREAEPPA